MTHLDCFNEIIETIYFLLKYYSMISLTFYRKWMKDLNDRTGNVDGRDIMVGSTQLYKIIWTFSSEETI